MNITEYVKVVILGIIEGITEWLPISSTGHLILANEFIKLNMTEQFMEMFNVVIQLGAIMAVVVLYFHKLNPFSPRKRWKEKMDTMQRIAHGFQAIGKEFHRGKTCFVLFQKPDCLNQHSQFQVFFIGLEIVGRQIAKTMF